MPRRHQKDLNLRNAANHCALPNVLVRPLQPLEYDAVSRSLVAVSFLLSVPRFHSFTNAFAKLFRHLFPLVPCRPPSQFFRSFFRCSIVHVVVFVHTPLQIFYTIICSNFVLVIYNGKSLWILYKRFRYQPMHLFVFPRLVLIKCNIKISLRLSWRKSFLCHGIPDISVVRNLIYPFVSNHICPRLQKSILSFEVCFLAGHQGLALSAPYIPPGGRILRAITRTASMCDALRVWSRRRVSIPRSWFGGPVYCRCTTAACSV